MLTLQISEGLEQTPQLKLQILTTKNTMGITFTKQGRHQDALNQFLECLALSKELSGPDSERSIQYLRNIGNAYTNLELYKEAADYFNQALNLHLKSKKPANHTLILIYDKLGLTHYKQGKRKEAL